MPLESNPETTSLYIFVIYIYIDIFESTRIDNFNTPRLLIKSLKIYNFIFLMTDRIKIV